MALTIPALLAERIAAHGNQTVLRKKHRGIWQAVTWSQLGEHVHEIARGLGSIGFEQGDVACVLAETRPECVYIDLGIIEAGGVSGAINPATEPDALGDMLQQANCRVLFVENEEQGVAILLVEQNAHMALRTAQFGYVLEVGRIVLADDCNSLMQTDAIKEFYLGQKEAGIRGQRRYKRKRLWH